MQPKMRIYNKRFFRSFIAGPPTHSVWGQYCFALWRASVIVVVCCRRLSFVVVFNTPRRRNVTHQGAAWAARDGGPVVLRHVRATRCLKTKKCFLTFLNFLLFLLPNNVVKTVTMVMMMTSVQSNLAKGRIAVLSPLTAANSFIGQAHSPLAAVEQCAMHSCIDTSQWPPHEPPQKWSFP